MKRRIETMAQPQLIVDEGQELEIWGMQVDADHCQIAFDCGDNGFLKLTQEQTRTLRDTLNVLLGE
jgi:hypothetical protein